ncbi:TPA: extracellular solute-binding protein [Candidatus Bipolaricaulota bacterium]|nr:extracellular solute-binding protein [Candidatus Bipolaricaulota bacterium]
MTGNRKLDKRLAVPLYRQLKEILEERIRRGEFRPGERLPTERELCQQFGVSRITVRQALGELANEGLLYRHQGSGTFVNHRLPLKVKPIKVVVTEDRWVPPLRKASRLYNEGRQGEEIRLEVRTLGRPQLHDKIVSAVGEGKAPDLALIDWVWMTEFADLQYIEPLDELDREWTEEFKADLFPLFVENNSYRGHLYGVQIEASVAVIWYRRDILAEEGLPPPRTWEGLVEVARALSNEEVRGRHGLGPFPIAFPGGPNAGETTTYILSALIWSAGGELSSGGRITLDEGARRALEFLHDLVHKYRLASPAVSSYGFNEVPRLFARGEAALAFGGSYEKALIQEVAGWDEQEFRERVGFIPIPAGPGAGGREATTVGGMIYVIFRQSVEPISGLELLKLLSGPELMEEFCRRTGRKPTRISVARGLDPEKDWFIHETSKLLRVARVRPTIPQYARVSSRLQVMLANVLSGEETVDEAVERAQVVIEALA